MWSVRSLYLMQSHKIKFRVCFQVYFPLFVTDDRLFKVELYEYICIQLRIFNFRVLSTRGLRPNILTCRSYKPWIADC
jgi:hypothetical protein